MSSEGVLARFESRFGRSEFSLLLASMAALFLELMIIRWASSEIPIFAYFKNFPLLAAFIGLGVGSLISENRRFFWVSSLWALCGMTVMVAFSDRLGLHGLMFPEPNIDLWDLPFSPESPLRVWIKNLLIIFFIVGCCVWSFVGPGQAVGRLIRSGPPLRMYTFDILGSLAGVLGFSFLSFLYTPPSVWLIVAVILLGVVGVRLEAAPAKVGSREAPAAPAKVGSREMPAGRGKVAPPLVLILLVALAAFVRTQRSDVVLSWSPYYRIEVRPVYRTLPDGTPDVWRYNLDVNRWIHQLMINLNDEARVRLEPNTPEWMEWMRQRIQYDFPFFFKSRPESVLIAGAGSGNDVSGALRNGAGRVTAVEIDPGILRLGKRMHPARPYSSDRVRIVNTDIRAFLRRSDEKFDLIIYSILDSHTALSSLSSLRLDNYVYTMEGIRDAVAHLKPDGVMSLSFYESNRTWLGERLYSSIHAATGMRPAATRIWQACAFVFGPGITREAAHAKLEALKIGFEDTEWLHGRLAVKPSTDDWPFLYSNPKGQPVVYYLSLGLLVLLGGGFVWWGLKGAKGSEAGTRLDLPMFFLGAGFLLIETKGLAELSLLFGSTWIVNTIVFSGIFVMVLLANWAVSRGATRYFRQAFGGLAAALLFWYFFPRASLNALDFWPRAFFGSLLVVLPLFFAGIVFASLFAKRRDTNIAFGSNLMGAVLGGAVEASSLVWGIRMLTLLAVGFYALAAVAALGEKDQDGAGRARGVE